MRTTIEIEDVENGYITRKHAYYLTTRVHKTLQELLDYIKEELG